MHYVSKPSQSAPTDPAEAMARAIGLRVRSARLACGWTLDQLALRSGVSRRMVVNVEQGSANPSIATLLRLSDALGIGLPALVDTADDAEPVTVHRAGAASPMWTSPAGGTAVMVAGTNPPDVNELWDWRLGPGDRFDSEAHRAGTRELLLVVSGAIDLVVDGVQHRLRAGDSATFDGGRDHRYANVSATRPARFTLAVYEPVPPGDAS
jgi:transcriptional regulator with XRE-family HTH domain